MHYHLLAASDISELVSFGRLEVGLVPKGHTGWLLPTEGALRTMHLLGGINPQEAQWQIW